MVEVNAYNNTSYARDTHVTLGIPFEEGILTEGSSLVVDGATSSREYVQWYPQGARWNDGSVKYARATFPISISANAEKTVNVTPGTGGTSSTFSTSIQAEIDNTVIQLRLTLAKPSLATARVVSFGPSPLNSGHTRIVFADYELPAYDPLYPDREETTGWITPTTLGVRLLGFTTASNTVYNSTRITATWISRTTVDLQVRDSNYVVPVLTASHLIQFGVWRFIPDPSVTTIDCNLSDAVEIAETAEEPNTSRTHYKRYRVFARPEYADDLWAEVVFDVYKNSRRIKFWFSWGNSFVEIGHGRNRRTPVNTGSSFFTRYFRGPVQLVIKKRTSTGISPKVGIEGRDYKCYDYIENSSENSYTIMHSDRDPGFTSSNGTRYDRKNMDVIANSISMHYKGTILYPSGALSASDQGELTGDPVYAVATNWRLLMPPYFYYPDIPDGFASREAAVTDMIAMFNRHFIPTYKVGFPIQLGNMSFGPFARPGAPGSQHEAFISLPAHWLIATSHAFAMKWLSIQSSFEAFRPLWRIRGDGDEWMPEDHGYLLNTDLWVWHLNTLDLGGYGPNQYTATTDTYPAPALQGLKLTGGATKAGYSRDFAYPYSSTEDTGIISKGPGKSHWGEEWQAIYAFLSMDYLGLKYSKWCMKAWITDHWADQRAPDNIWTTHESGRAIGRPSRSAARLLELFDDAVLLENIQGRIAFMESEPGHGGYVTDEKYPGSEYEYLKPYKLASDTDARSLIQEYFASGWMEGIAGSGLYALYTVLKDRTDVLQATKDVLFKVVKDVVATYVQYFILDTDNYNVIEMARVDRAIALGLGSAMPPTDFVIPGDVLELETDSSAYFTVMAVLISDDSPYNRIPTPWELTSEYRIGVTFTAKDLVNSANIKNFRSLRNRRTGLVLTTETGGTKLTINNIYRGYKTCAGYATTLEPGVDIIDPAYMPGNAPNWLTPMPFDDLFSVIGDYIHDPSVRNTANPPQPTSINYTRGNQLAPLSTNGLRYWSFEKTLIYWGLGIVAVAKKYADAGEFGAASAAIGSKSQDIINYFINEELGNNNTWEQKIVPNLYVAPIGTSDAINVRRFLSTASLLITPPAVDGSGNGGISEHYTFPGYDLNLNITAYTPTRRTSTSTDLLYIIGEPVTLDIIANPVELDISNSIAQEADTAVVNIGVPEFGFDAINGNFVNNVVNWRRKLFYVLHGYVSPGAGEEVGVYGSPDNFGSEEGLSENDWIITAEYVSADDLINKFGYSTVPDDVFPGYWVAENTFVPYSVYVEQAGISEETA